MKIAKRIIIATVLLVGIIFYFFYPFKIQPIRIAFDKGSTYVFDISSSGLTKIIKCDVKDLDLSNENNFININKAESRTMFISGTDRRFINRYAKKLLQTNYDIEYGKYPMTTKTMVYAYTEGQKYWSRYTMSDKEKKNTELMEIAFRIVEISPVKLEDLYTPKTYHQIEQQMK